MLEIEEAVLSQPVKIPHRLLRNVEKRVYELNSGEYAFVPPEAMWVDRNNDCWMSANVKTNMDFIDPIYAVAFSIPILIQRNGTGVNVILSSRTDQGYKWEPQSIDSQLTYHSEHGLDVYGDLPVVSLLVDDSVYKQQFDLRY